MDAIDNEFQGLTSVAALGQLDPLVRLGVLLHLG